MDETAKTGTATGGPAAGETFTSKASTVLVPVQTGPDSGEGDRGFSAAHYVWHDGAWRFTHIGKPFPHREDFH